MWEIVDSDYIEHCCGKWKDVKPHLIKWYESKYSGNIKLKRVKTDTKFCYMFLVMKEV